MSKYRLKVAASSNAYDKTIAFESRDQRGRVVSVPEFQTNRNLIQSHGSTAFSLKVALNAFELYLTNVTNHKFTKRRSRNGNTARSFIGHPGGMRLRGQGSLPLWTRLAKQSREPLRSVFSLFNSSLSNSV